MMDELIAKLEAAEQGSRELDAEIHVLVNRWALFKVGADYDGGNESSVYTQGGKELPGFQYPPKGKIDQYYHVPDFPENRYTRILDAALTLAPGGWRISLVQTDKGLWGVHLEHEKLPNVSTSARTAALALCIAALKARQAVT